MVAYFQFTQFFSFFVQNLSRKWPPILLRLIFDDINRLPMRIPSFFFLLLAAGPLYAQSPIPPPSIAVDQLGFYAHAPKYAIVTGPAAGDLFFVVSVGSNSPSWTSRADTVFIGHLGPVMASANSSLSTRLADFSAFHRVGIYRVVVPGFPNSYPFPIGEEVFYRLTKAVLKGYYFQRSAMALTPDYAGLWARPAGHPDTQVLVHASAAGPGRPEGSVISATGGWYDAGDYGNQICRSTPGITMGTLLEAYEDFPAYFDTLRTNIPPVGGSGVSGVRGTGALANVPHVPDILNETLYNLRWMLQMQDPADGGVYNKCTNAAFDGMVMPGVTKTARYVVQKGTAATLDFAAVTAQAARVFDRFSDRLPGLADSCRRASVSAWDWALRYPDSVYDQNAMNRKFTPAITTGGYGDNFFGDERYWAASELLITTGDARYLAAVNQSIGAQLALPSWAYVAMLGNYSLLRRRAQLPVSLTKALDSMRQHFLRLADEYTDRAAATAFHTVMGERRSDFVWGSNSVAANEGMLLISAWLEQHKQAYLDGALSNLDYLLGRNATGYCFVTGMGSHSPMHPHHRSSISDGVVPPVPGLLAGGPNAGRQDGQHYIYLEPETAYLDNDQAYASNEIAINWNAPLVYLSGGLEALQYAAGYSQHDQAAPSLQATGFTQPGAANVTKYEPGKDRSGLYRSNFPVRGLLSEQIVLRTDGTFEFRYDDNAERKSDTAEGTYAFIKDKLLLMYGRPHPAMPGVLYVHGRKLYETNEKGRMVKRADGPSGTPRKYLLFGTRKRRHYLDRADS